MGPILGELANDHALTWSKQSDGSFRCVVYSAGNKDMKAPEGPVLRIPVVLAASFEEESSRRKTDSCLTRPQWAVGEGLEWSDPYSV